jgi:hypothetical protein
MGARQLDCEAVFGCITIDGGEVLFFSVCGQVEGLAPWATGTSAAAACHPARPKSPILRVVAVQAAGGRKAECIFALFISVPKALLELAVPMCN